MKKTQPKHGASVNHRSAGTSGGSDIPIRPSEMEKENKTWWQRLMKKRWFRWSWKLFSLFVAWVIGGISWQYFTPNVDYAPNSAFFDETYPIDVPITIINNGNLGIVIKQVICGIDKLEIGNNTSLAEFAIQYEQNNSVLLPRESADWTFKPSAFKFLISNPKGIHSELLFIVKYKLLIFPHVFEKRQRYTVVTGKQGQLVWTKRFLTDADRKYTPKTIIETRAITNR